MAFAKDFVWGAASSACQIEGYSTEDGGGESIWDAFCRRDGAIAGGENIAVACDAYHRYEEDIAEMAKLGIRHYRFSTSWARVDPMGDGNWNGAGLAYYDRVVDCCLKHGITPWITLYHWELPQALEERGGWLEGGTAEAFARFAGHMAEHFRGRVSRYFTLNEPQIVLQLGYANGVHAPGRRYPLPGLFLCWKHLMISHGLAARAIRGADPSAAVGLASTGRLCYGHAPCDRDAAKRETFRLTDEEWMFTHSAVLDAICFGHVSPEPGALADLMQTVTPEEWDCMHALPDMIGINAYNGNEVASDAEGRAVYLPRERGCARTALKWPITPEIMEEGMTALHERYGLPIYITECGQSCNDRIFLDGCVHDPDRIDFLHRYLKSLGRAADIADVRGFFHWSLTDNFEWHSGYTERFGLIYIDYPTLRRIPKDSAKWYADVIASNGSKI